MYYISFWHKSDSFFCQIKRNQPDLIKKSQEGKEGFNAHGHHGQDKELIKINLLARRIRHKLVIISCEKERRRKVSKPSLTTSYVNLITKWIIWIWLQYGNVVFVFCIYIMLTMLIHPLFCLIVAKAPAIPKLSTWTISLRNYVVGKG